MKAIAIAAAAAALVALAGCDRLGIGGGNVAANDSANASTNAAGGDKDGANSAAATPAATGGKDGGGAIPAASNDGAPALDRAYVSGRWTDDGNCGAAVEFTNDGRFVAANGNEGLWNLQGDRLTMQGERTLTLQIVPIDQNTMTVVNPDGSLGRSTRC
jgi:hypothetical protein